MFIWVFYTCKLKCEYNDQGINLVTFNRHILNDTLSYNKSIFSTLISHAYILYMAFQHSLKYILLILLPIIMLFMHLQESLKRPRYQHYLQDFLCILLHTVQVSCVNPITTLRLLKTLKYVQVHVHLVGMHHCEYLKHKYAEIRYCVQYID